MLPKNERQMLCKYHKLLKKSDEGGKFVNLSEQAFNATMNLTKRGLIYQITENSLMHVEALTIALCDKGYNLNRFLSESKDDISCLKIIIALSLDDCDTAIKYKGLYYWSGGMWWSEYRGHWVFTVIGMLLTFLAGLVTGILTT